MIVELLDKYHVDEFDDLLIEIIKNMQEQKETRQENEDEDILSESDFSQLEEQKYHVEENEDDN